MNPYQVYVGSSPSLPKPDRRSFSKSFVWSFALAILIIGGGVFGYTYALPAYNNSRAEQTSRQFISYLNSAQTSKAYALTTSNVQKHLTAAVFTSNMGNLSSTNAKFSSEKLSTKGSKAIYTVSQKGLVANKAGSTKANYNILLVKAGLFKWKIDGVSVN